MKKKLFYLIKITISVSFIAILIWTKRDSLDSAVDVIKNINIALFITGSALFICASVIIAVRLKFLLKVSKVLLNNAEAVSLTFIGYFFNNFLPTTIGGDVVKAYYASKKTTDKVGCFTTIFMDRLFGTISLFLLGALAALFAARTYAIDKSLIWTVLGILAVLAVSFLILWNKNLSKALLSPVLVMAKPLKMEEKLKRAYTVIHSFKKEKQLIIWVFGISIIAQLASFSSVYFWANGLGSPLTLQIVLMAMPIIVILATVMPSINGLGVREWAIVYFFGPRIGDQNAIALGILWLFLTLVTSVIGGLNYAFDSQYRVVRPA